RFRRVSGRRPNIKSPFGRVANGLLGLVLRALIGEPLNLVRKVLDKFPESMRHRLVDEPDDIAVKERTFFRYPAHDLAVVAIKAECDVNPLPTPDPNFQDVAAEAHIRFHRDDLTEMWTLRLHCELGQHERIHFHDSVNSFLVVAR